MPTVINNVTPPQMVKVKFRHAKGSFAEALPADRELPIETIPRVGDEIEVEDGLGVNWYVHRILWILAPGPDEAVAGVTVFLTE